MNIAWDVFHRLQWNFQGLKIIYLFKFLESFIKFGGKHQKLWIFENLTFSWKLQKCCVFTAFLQFFKILQGFWEIFLGAPALRVPPAETRLTVYRRRDIARDPGHGSKFTIGQTGTMVSKNNILGQILKSVTLVIHFCRGVEDENGVKMWKIWL